MRMKFLVLLFFCVGFWTEAIAQFPQRSLTESEANKVWFGIWLIIALPLLAFAAYILFKAKKSN